jgi:pimeloyl-ACP methyl ester carboxylesterase
VGLRPRRLHGGMRALEGAVTYPERVGSAVLLATSASSGAKALADLFGMKRSKIAGIDTATVTVFSPCEAGDQLQTFKAGQCLRDVHPIHNPSTRTCSPVGVRLT